VFNYDETSLLKKKFFVERHIVPKGSKLIPHEVEIPLVTHCTAGMCVAADGSHLTTALLLPESVPTAAFDEYDSVNLKIYSSLTGFITAELFGKHFLETIFPEIAIRQAKFTRDGSQERALLFMDGHSSRLQRTVWEKAASMGIDVCILPSHTSHVLQPLDNGVNAKFKSLLASVVSLPKKRRIGEDLLPWLESVEDAIEGSLTRKLIRHSFAVTGLFPLLPEVVLSKVPTMCGTSSLIRRQSIQIGACIITNDSFLKTWEDTDSKKKQAKEEKKERALSRSKKKQKTHDKKKEEITIAGRTGRRKRRRKSKESEEETDPCEEWESGVEEEGKEGLGESDEIIGEGGSHFTEEEDEDSAREIDSEDQDLPEDVELRQLPSDEVVIAPKESRKVKQRISLEEQYELLLAGRERLKQLIHQARTKQFKAQGKRLQKAFSITSPKVPPNPTDLIILQELPSDSSVMEIPREEFEKNVEVESRT
jgi:hypothetical protein